MTEQTTKYWELYIKQKDGTIKPEEKSELETWIDHNPAEFHGFEVIFQATESEQPSAKWDPNERWQEMKTIIKIDSDARGAWTIRIFPWIARVAAAVILVLGFTYIFYQYQNFSSDDLNIQTMVQTNDSDQKVVKLPDGSIIWLNRNSELLYPEIFDGEIRTIYLKGEAFFEVTPNKEKPTIVHAGSSKTTVLGTSFNLRAYSKKDDVKLTVVSGKVTFALADDKEKVIVLPGNMASLDNESKLVALGPIIDLNFLSWKSKHLTFNDSPIAELIKQLERHYGIKISVQNPAILNCRFTGDFHETDIENVIKIITRATGTTYELIEGQYIIMGSGCK